MLRYRRRFWLLFFVYYRVTPLAYLPYCCSPLRDFVLLCVVRLPPANECLHFAAVDYLDEHSPTHEFPAMHLMLSRSS